MDATEKTFAPPPGGRRSVSEAATEGGGKISYSDLLASENVAQIIDILLSDELSLDTVCTEILAVAKKLTSSRDSLVGVVDSVDRSLLCRTTAGSLDASGTSGMHPVVFRVARNDRAESPWGRGLNTQETYCTNTPAEHEIPLGPAPPKFKLKNFLSAPAIVGDNRFGLIAVANKDGDYTEEDCKVIERLSAIFALFVMRKQLEERLQSSESKYRDMLNDALDMIHIIDTEGCILDTNPIELQTMGYSFEEYVGTSLLDLVHPDFREQTARTLRHVLRGHKVKGFHTAVVSRKGDVIQLEVNLVPQFKDGKAVSAMVISRDITQRVEEQKVMHSSNEDLESMVEARTAELHAKVREERETKLAMLNIMEDLEISRNDAMAATKAKSLFLANMSHEIRTPINAVLGMLHLTLDTDLTEKQRQYLKKSQHAATTLQRIIDDILDFSKIEAGKLELEQSSFSLDATIRQVTEVVGFRAAQKGVELLVRMGNDVPRLMQGDATRVGQVLTNLCSNAIKFTEEGEIEVDVSLVKRSEHGVKCKFCVRDTGIGIPPAKQAALFDKFTQLDPTFTRQHGGTGLGLTISAKLAELMGGACWLEHSEPGVGSMFCFTAVFGPAEDKDNDDLARSKQLSAVARKAKFLVVDDSPAARGITCEMLRHLDLDCESVASGEEALAYLEDAAEPVDVVLMDYDMPAMDGKQAIHAIRASDRVVALPKFVLLATFGSPRFEAMGGETGADELLLKPVSPSRLADCLLPMLGEEAGLRTRSADERNGRLPRMQGVELLLVEDNEFNREVARELLRQTGAVVTEAIDGLEAVEKIRAKSFDGVLMDIQMPKLDGIEATRRIRALSRSDDDRFATLPIIAMTAQATAGDRERSLDAGMNDFVTKPIDLGRLALALETWINVDRSNDVNQSGKSTSSSMGPELTPAESVIDFAEGIERLGGNEALFYKLLRRFSDEYAGAVKVINDLILEGDLAKAESECHGLKGVTGNLSMASLFETAKAVDDQLKQGRVPPASAMDNFEAQLQQVIAEIKSLQAN